MKGILSSDGCAFLFDCPGCGQLHAVWVKQPACPGDRQYPVWSWNGSLDTPTFTPSLLVKGGDFEHPHAVCHSFIRDGRIQFLSDCTHALTGQTVEMQEVKP